VAFIALATGARSWLESPVTEDPVCESCAGGSDILSDEVVFAESAPVVEFRVPTGWPPSSVDPLVVEIEPEVHRKERKSADR